MRFSIRLLLLFMFCTLMGNAPQAQPNRDTFGKSRIQYKNFDWKLYSTQNFNVYFYQGGQEAAKNAAEYAEKELRRVTSLIGYYPYSKITLILYNSPTDLLQSNIGLNSDQYQTGGETLFMKSKIELAYEGTQTEFKTDLSYELTELLMNDMMYGGSLKEALQSSYLLRLPEWFISGVAAYTAEGWSIEMDNYMRNMLQKQQQQGRARPEKLFAINPELTGQSVWNYIAERYGYTAIQNILNLTRITRDVEIGITSSLNIPYNRFLQDWYNYYKQINTGADSQLISLQDDNKLFKKNKEGHFYGEPVLNPNGTLLAYVKNDNGIFKIFVQDVRTGKDRVVWRAGYKSVDQKVDYKIPVLAWRSNTLLGFVEARRGKMMLREVDARDRFLFVPFVENLTTQASVLEQFSQVRSMSYSEDGQNLVVSAVRNGQTDLFLLRANGRLQQQLTNDVFDDLEPAYLKNNGGIAFSSNRWVDSTGNVASATFGSVVNNYDIFLLQQEGPNSNVRQLTSSIASELKPKATQDGNLVYLSEQSGIRSIYRYDMSTGTSTPVTSFVQGIEEYDYVPSANVLALISRDEGRNFVYLLPSFTPTTLAELPKTSRQIILETRARTTQSATSNVRKLVEENTNTITRRSSPKRKTGEVNIDNYEFDNEAAEEAEPEVKRQAPVRRATAARPFQMVGPLDYDLRFSVQEIVTSVHSDPLLGFGFVAGVNMSDLFENHHIRGTAFLRTDLETSNFWAEYMNLKNRVDVGVQFERKTLVGGLLNAPGSEVRFAKNELTPVIEYPLSHSTSLRVMPKLVSTRFTYLTDFFVPDTLENLWGGNLEFVYDNSVRTGINMLEGTRVKVGLLSLKGLEGSVGDFSKVYVDFRNYLKIHREIVLATRISYGAFFGNSTKQFLIGGMDNWLLADEDESAELNDVEITSPADLFYLEYVTPLRGFNFNVRSGSRHLLANAELRVPIVQYLYNGPIASGFFRNLQLVGFADAGSAYNGANPFSGNNSINTRVIGGVISPTQRDNFEISVINYRNPFLVGYGVGARTTVLGVYGKLDVAWGEAEDRRTGPKFYITLGYDF